MTTQIDMYWSFRSPYSYLALKQVLEIERAMDVQFNPKIVLPLAIRDPGFFKSRGPAWLGYTIRDMMRIAQMTEQVIAAPNPDPIVQDMSTLRVSDEQPHIYRLSRLGLVAAEAGRGLPFLDEVSRLIWSSQCWTDDGMLEAAAERSGLDLITLRASIAGREQVLDMQLSQNDQDLRTAGHWGVPTFVLNGEPFFGMDRLPVLQWRLKQE